jgi:hypothetical protein
MRVLRKTLRPLDLSCIGRDENLLVCLPGVNSGEAGSVAQSIRRNLVQSRLLGKEARVVSSLRISSATFPLDGRSRRELLEAVSGRRENEQTAVSGSCAPRDGAPAQDADEGSGSPPEGTGRSV